MCPFLSHLLGAAPGCGARDGASAGCGPRFSGRGDASAGCGPCARAAVLEARPRPLFLGPASSPCAGAALVSRAAVVCLPGAAPVFGPPCWRCGRGPGPGAAVVRLLGAAPASRARGLTVCGCGPGRGPRWFTCRVRPRPPGGDVSPAGYAPQGVAVLHVRLRVRPRVWGPWCPVGGCGPVSRACGVRGRVRARFPGCGVPSAGCGSRVRAPPSRARPRPCPPRGAAVFRLWVRLGVVPGLRPRSWLPAGAG